MQSYRLINQTGIDSQEKTSFYLETYRNRAYGPADGSADDQRRQNSLHSLVRIIAGRAHKTESSDQNNITSNAYLNEPLNPYVISNNIIWVATKSCFILFALMCYKINLVALDCLKVDVHTIWCHFGQFKFVQKDHFQRNTSQSYISI